MALFAAGCENKTESQGAEVAAAAADQALAQPVDNPNVASEADAVVVSENAPVMTFDETEYDFGTIKQGEVVNHTFTFTNTGASPLIIENASATCGCTVPQWTTEPVAPGRKGEIKVQFNSTGKSGQQQPTVTVRANTQPNIVRVAMKGNVEASNTPTAGSEGPVKRN